MIVFGIIFIIASILFLCITTYDNNTTTNEKYLCIAGLMLGIFMIIIENVVEPIVTEEIIITNSSPSNYFVLDSNTMWKIKKIEKTPKYSFLILNRSTEYEIIGEVDKGGISQETCEIALKNNSDIISEWKKCTEQNLYYEKLLEKNKR
jgi:hypothetical protein